VKQSQSPHRRQWADAGQGRGWAQARETKPIFVVRADAMDLEYAAVCRPHPIALVQSFALAGISVNGIMKVLVGQGGQGT